MIRQPFPIPRCLWILPFLLGTMIAGSVPTVTTDPASNVTDLQATLNATVNANGLGLWICQFQLGKTVSYELAPFSPERFWVYGPTDGSTPIAISGNPPSEDFAMEPNTIYHYRMYVRESSGTSKYYGADQTFTTLSARTKPVISASPSGPPSVVGYNVASVKCSVFSGSSAAGVSVQYGLTEEYGSQVSAGENLDLNTTRNVAVEIPQLTPDTQYFYRWKASNDQGIAFGAKGSLTTPAMPSVTTTAATAITTDKAVLHGVINANDGQTVSCLFDYGMTDAYGMRSYNGEPGSVRGAEPVEVTALITGLLPNTTYHYRILGNQADMGNKTYGTDMTFTTNSSASVPVIEGPFSASHITTRSASVHASSVTAGTHAASISFQYGVTTSYGANVSFLTAEANTTYDKPAVTLSGLLPNTTYHYRCKAKNINGTTFGSDGVFTTASIPIVTTGSAINIGDISATLGGTIVAGGGPCYPTIQWGKTIEYGSAMPFQSNIDASGSVSVGWSAFPLEPSTTYHFRLAVSDGELRIYGEDETFTTAAPSTPPWITITRVNYAGFGIYDHQRPDVSADSARLLASFNSGAAAATLSFEYGTSSEYGSEVVYPEVIPALSVMNYTICGIKDLSPVTEYHFRSKVTSAVGTAYSQDYTFTTLQLPIVVTNPAVLASDNDALLTGSVDPNLWHYYLEFEFGTTPEFGSTPELSLPSGIDGYKSGSPLDGPQKVSASASQLLPETTYHYRLNAKTLAFGEWRYYHGPVQTFTTLAIGAPAFEYLIGTAKNKPASIGNGSILTHIAGSDGLSLNVSGAASSSARGGVVTRSPSGVTYTPPPGYTGLDSFAMSIADGLGGIHDGMITAMVSGTAGPNNHQTQLDIQPNGDVAVVFQGNPGLGYHIQRSTDLKTWITLQSITAADNGMLPFIDTNPPHGSAYYRIKGD